MSEELIKLCVVLGIHGGYTLLLLVVGLTCLYLGRLQVRAQVESGRPQGDTQCLSIWYVPGACATAGFVASSINWLLQLYERVL